MDVRVVARALGVLSLAIHAACAARPNGNGNGDGSVGDDGSIITDGSNGLDSTAMPDGGVTTDGTIAFDASSEGGAPIDRAPPGDTGRICSPGESTCADGVMHICRSDGRAFVDVECDPIQGNACVGDTCQGACAPQLLGSSYFGCDYYPTVTLNPVYAEFNFAVAVANTTGEATTATVTRGTETITTVTIAANETSVITLPWVTELKGPAWMGSTNVPPPVPSMHVVEGAYRLRTTRPVTVYQYNALEYRITPTVPSACPQSGGERGCASYSNDSSLLFPVNSLGREYIATAWPSLGGSSLLAITATEDDTHVRVESPPSVEAIPGGGIDMNGDGELVMNRGDVVQLVAPRPLPPPGGPFGGTAPYGSDFTGARITSDRPVQVIGGNQCADVPTIYTHYCDHIEESALPLGAIGDEYVVGPFEPAVDGAIGPYTMRLQGVVFPTVVTFDPPVLAYVNGAVTTTTVTNVMLTEAAPLVQIADVLAPTRLTGDRPFLATQYMEGADATRGTLAVAPLIGDPAQSTMPPARQWRDQYDFVASSTYETNWVNVYALRGTTVTIDGIPVPAGDWVNVNTTGPSYYVAARFRLGVGDAHRARGNGPFGITVYGYGAHTSYAYPGGLDLTQRPF